MPPVLLALLLICAGAAQAGRLEGTVVDAAGEPVEGAYVQASAGAPPEVVAQGQTDGNGRYSFDAPTGRLTLSVAASGYYVVSAGGLDSETITQSCPEEGPCGEIHFRVGKPGVVEGWLTDRFGDPVAGVPLFLRPVGSPPPSKPGYAGLDIRGRAASDDRGYFRIWNLRPGRYQIETFDRILPFPQFRQFFSLPPQEVEIGEQAETVELRISVQSDDEMHTISGVVEGIDAQTDGHVILNPKSSNRQLPFASRYPLREGRFTIPGLKTGEYVLRVGMWKPGQNGPDVRLLAELRVDRDLSGLRLAPQPPSGLQLTFNFGESGKSNLYLQLLPVGGSGVAERLDMHGPDYESIHRGLIPGEYELRLLSDDYYLAEAYRLTVQPGQITAYTIAVGSEFAALRGRVRVAQGEGKTGASHFTVGARGPHGRYKAQADGDGRFVFEKLPPGSYRLAAWMKPDINVEDDGVWSDAAGVVSRIELEPGFDVEIDLTALP
jgi:hypothetical protein